MAPPAPPVHLEWLAPADCPSQSDVLGAIERMIGTGGLRGAVDARVIVTPGEGEFRAEVTVSASGATSTRSLVGESCRAVADAATVIVSLAANPGPTPPEPEPPPAPMLPTSPSSAATESPSRRSVVVEGSFLFDSGLLPSASFGGELGAGWSVPHVDLEIVGAFLGSQRATLASVPSQGAAFWLAHLGARACYEPFDARLDVGPCAGAGFEWIAARGFGAFPDQPANATGQMAVGSLGGRALYRLSPRVVLRLAGEAVVPWTRPTFVIDGGGQVFRVPVASFRATVGAEAHF
jgi:hypothetical protein